MGKEAIHPKIQVSIAGEEMFFGPGPYRLLKIIDETGSVREACNEMGLSYSKAWKILNRMENEMGRKVIIRSRGGSEGGHSTVTEFGKEYLKSYEEYNESVQAYAKKEMKRIFVKLGAEPAGGNEK